LPAFAFISVVPAFAFISVVNVEDSTMARESGAIFPLLCGAEIGVASTKAFTMEGRVAASHRTAALAERHAPSPEACAPSREHLRKPPCRSGIVEALKL
jgi:glucosamine--fructose-6-phosphate aminotransferase (isomerizing)